MKPQNSLKQIKLIKTKARFNWVKTSYWSEMTIKIIYCGFDIQLGCTF